MHERIGPNCDARIIINTRRQAQHDANLDGMAANADDAGPAQPDEEHGDSRPRRDGRQGDRHDDWSPSPDGPGPQDFGRRFQRASFPQCFRLPTNIAKSHIDSSLQKQPLKGYFHPYSR
jgi:hypothetical protein